MMSNLLIFRYFLAFLFSTFLSLHGKLKNSLNISGSIAAFFVGFSSFAASYRFGLILILFYYSSSKLTKVKENVKSKLEENYSKGGQRNYIQVLANSFLATFVALIYFFYIGEDSFVSFSSLASDHIPNENFVLFHGFEISKRLFSSYLWCLYISHYSCATADTWASEIGILSKNKPRLVTSLFFVEVPHGTNGGMSLLGTLASAMGGLFIGLLFWVFSFCLNMNNPQSTPQYPMIFVGLISGVMGSLLDSLLGALLQATYYSTEKRCIVKHFKSPSKDPSVIRVSGADVLSNEAVNFYSILLTMLLSLFYSPLVFNFFVLK